MSNENKFVIPEGCKKLGNEEMSGVNGGWALVLKNGGAVGYLTHEELKMLANGGHNPILPVQPVYQLPEIIRKMIGELLSVDKGNGVKFNINKTDIFKISPITSEKDIIISHSNKVHY